MYLKNVYIVTFAFGVTKHCSSEVWKQHRLNIYFLRCFYGFPYNQPFIYCYCEMFRAGLTLRSQSAVDLLLKQINTNFSEKTVIRADGIVLNLRPVSFLRGG